MGRESFLISVLSLFPQIMTSSQRSCLTVHMMSAPREACRWRCYHEHCLAATEAAAAPRHHLYTALRRDTARVRSLLSRDDAALSDAQDAATRRKSVENCMAVGQPSSIQATIIINGYSDSGGGKSITCLYPPPRLRDIRSIWLVSAF